MTSKYNQARRRSHRLRNFLGVKRLVMRQNGVTKKLKGTLYYNLHNPNAQSIGIESDYVLNNQGISPGFQFKLKTLDNLNKYVPIPLNRKGMIILSNSNKLEIIIK